MPADRILLIVCFNFLIGVTFCQVTLSINITDGASTTTCTDGTFGGGPEPHWSVDIAGQGYVTYPSLAGCYQDFPNIQYQEIFDCPSDYPSTIQVCLRAFEDDGASCVVSASCLEQNCQNFNVPSPGGSSSYTLAVSGTSSGSVDFTISTSGSLIFSPDGICNAINLGTLSSNGFVGNASASNYNNLCASSFGDPNPWGGENDAGVWFSFTTSSTPSSTIDIEGISDPQLLGDDINLQLALYESANNTCTGLLTLVGEVGADASNNTTLSLTCLEENTNYFILVDGQGTSDLEVGRFGVEVTDDGVDDPADGCSALPVELTSFKAANISEDVHIQWETALEVNNDHFLLESSSNGNDFTVLGKIKGIGNSSSNKTYQYIDKYPSIGVSYYKLTQVDFDGTSEVVGLLRHEYQKEINSILYPSSTSKTCRIVYYSSAVQDAIVSIIDSSGNNVFSKSQKLVQGNNSIPLTVSSFRSGSYVVLVKSRSEAKQYRLIIE